MGKIISGLMVIALLTVCRLVWATPVPYILTPFTGSRVESVLTGSITVNDTVDIGHVDQSEITAWQFRSTGTISFSFGSGDLGETFSCFNPFECFSIVGPALRLPPAPPPDSNPPFTGVQFNNTLEPVTLTIVSFTSNFPPGLNRVFWSVPAGGPCCFSDPDFVDLPPGGVVALAATVPEPSSIALVGIGLAVCFGVAATRSWKRQNTAV
jgi:PEP-CTERM motif